MSTNLTDREFQLLSLVWQSLRAPMEVDLDKLVSKSGYKTKASANTAYHKLKNKILAAGKPAGADDEADADAEETPVPASSVKKGRGKKAAPVKAEDSDEDADGESETIAVKPNPKATRAALNKAGTAKPVVKGRSTRTSLKAKKPLVKSEPEGDSEEEFKPVGRARTATESFTPEQVWESVASMIDAAEDRNADPENIAVDQKTLKRAATEPASDFDELDTNKRVKGEDDAVLSIETSASTVPTIESTDPLIVAYTVDDNLDAGNVTADITMTTEDPDATSDVPSDVASANTSIDGQDI